MNDALLAQIQTVDLWYHCIELAPGVVTPGAFDMRPWVDSYRLPETLRGLRVVDVGTSNGFFAFHMESLHADQVVATELPTISDHDCPYWVREKHRDRVTPELLRDIDRSQLHGGFKVAHAALCSRVVPHRSRVDDLGAHFDEEFDLAFCSNVLTHLRDPLGALDALWRILKPGGRLILTTQTEPGNESVARFLEGPEAFAWWRPTAKAVAVMLEKSGFEEVETVSEFQLTRIREPFLSELTTVTHGRKRRL